MGIYDREYYRREGPSFLGAWTGHGKVCKWLIAANVICFLLQWVTTTRHFEVEDDELGTPRFAVVHRPFTEALELDTRQVAHGQVWRLVTYAFLHDTGSLWHIVFNLLFLWWFGSEMEDRYGPREFLAFYLVAAFIGGLAFQLAWAAGQQAALCIGASGAVTAVMVLFAIHYPTRTIYIFGLLPLPIWVLVAFNVLQDLGVFIGGRDTGTAVTVHLGGAAFGWLYYQSGLRLSNLLPSPSGVARRWNRPKLKLYREEPGQMVTVPSGSASLDVDEHLEAKLDAVLEKVARSGRDSLTDAERQVLLRASEAFKKRRP